VFVGPNGTGKSNLIDAIRLIRDAAVSGLDHAVSERHGIDSLRQWSPSKPYHVTLEVDVVSRLDLRSFGQGSFSFTLASYRGSHVVRREQGRWWSIAEPGTSISYVREPEGEVRLLRRVADEDTQELISAEQPDELFLSQLEARDFRPLVNALASFEAYSIFPNVLRTPQKASNDNRLAPSGENLTSIFKALTRSKRRAHTGARAEILQAMRQVLPMLESIRIQSLGGLMVPVFRVREPDGRIHDFNVSQISDGTLRVLGLLTALYQPSRPDVIAMEEPEQTVHPGILAVLADAAKEISATSQVLITTHSPELVDRFDTENVMAVDLEGTVTRVGPVSPHQQQAVRDRLFSLGELMSVEGLHP
jgi:predicted ATPase